MTIIEQARDATTVPADSVTTVNAVTTRTPGRFIVDANGKPFVSDTRSSIGGPGEALQAGELLLSALASCGLGLIQKHARNQGVELGEVEISATFKRHVEDPTRYEYIKLAVAFGHGVSADTGDACIAHFTENCPIYNTLRRGGPISIERL
jgi:uncharacterized OsmC-like protein